MTICQTRQNGLIHRKWIVLKLESLRYYIEIVVYFERSAVHRLMHPDGCSFLDLTQELPVIPSQVTMVKCFQLKMGIMTDMGATVPHGIVEPGGTTNVATPT